LPFIVRRNHRIVAAFARKMAAEDCAQMRSRDDERRFTVHTAQEVIATYQDGRRRSDRLIEQFIESLHFGCNFIATASLSRSAGDQAIPALGETAADNTPGG
jgi:hypothetical protein